MKRTLQLVLFLALTCSVSLLQAQAWYVYDGTAVPDGLSEWSASSSKPGENMVEAVVDDTIIAGNKIFQYVQADALQAGETANAAKYYKHGFSGTSTAITVVARMKGMLIDSLSGEYAFQIETANGVVRSVVDIVTEDNKLKEEKGDAADTVVVADLSEWQIYRITLDDDSVNVYLNEGVTPVMAGYGAAKTDNHVRFGDAGGARVAGFVDWFVIDTTGAYAPGTGAVIPDSLSLDFGPPAVVVEPAWYVYDGAAIPDGLDGWSASSSKPGENMVEAVVVDPDIEGNKMFQYVQPDAFQADGTTKATKYYKHGFSGTSTAITVVARMKGILIDSLSGEYAFQIETANGVVRSVVDIVTEDNKLKEEKGDAADTVLVADLSEWQIYRITLDDDSVNVYLNEGVTPVMAGYGAAKTDNHVRFGDAGGARVAGCVDWFVIDTTGAYAPGAGAVIPDSLSLSFGAPDVVEPAWYVYDGTAIPDGLDGWSASSSKPGENMVEAVVVDPDIEGNKLFQYVQPDAFQADGTTKATKYYKHGFSGTSTAITVVARMKGILIDSLSGEYAFQIETANGVVRSVVDIVTEGNTLKEEKGDAADTVLVADLSEWQIYRITLDDDSVNVYLNEGVTPVMAGYGSAKTDNHVRFGDAGGARVAGFVDWFVIDTTGAYAPGTGAVIPDSLSLAFGPVEVEEILVTGIELSALVTTIDIAATTQVSETITPWNATDKTVSWSVDDDAIATVSSSGLVTGVSGGTATIKATANDGSEVFNTIQIVVNPAVVLSDDATLSRLVVSVGTLTPAFDAATLNYAVDVPEATTEVVITAQATHSAATVTGDGTIALTGNATTAVVNVKAEDGTSQDYTIVITKLVGVNSSLSAIPVKVYPNPFASEVNFKVILEQAETVTISITNLSGKVIETTSYEMNAGENNVILKTNNIKSGLYLYTISSNGNFSNGRLMKIE